MRNCDFPLELEKETRPKQVSKMFGWEVLYLDSMEMEAMEADEGVHIDERQVTR